VSLYRLHDLKRVKGNRAILDISQLELEAGRIYALLGANGAGKTTLLTILAFLERPTSGAIEFLGKTIRFAEQDLQKLRRDVIMVDQFPILFSGTVYSNLDFGLKIRKIPRSKRDRIIDEYLDLIDMRPFKWEQAQGLSGGETQRVALARALSLSPKVFLCDEPTSSVDVENQNAITAILRQVNETKNISIIFTTHDRLQAANLAQYTVVLDRGRVVQTTYENIFPCTAEKENGHLYCHINGAIKLRLPESLPANKTGRYRIFIDPKAIEVEMPTATPSGSSIQGKVVQLMEEGDQVRIVVKCGVLISVLLSRQRYSELQVAISDTVNLRIDPRKIQIMEPVR
jgi:tungstate transport system ATP-binding protein